TRGRGNQPVRSSRRQRTNSRHQLVDKRAGLHEHGEVPASVDRNEGLPRRPDGIDECARETGGGGEILRTLKHEDRNGEVTAERSCVERARLRNQLLAADLLTVEPVVDIAQLVTRRA